MNPITQIIKEKENNLLIELHARFSSDTYDHTPANVHWDNIDAVIKSHITQSHIALLESVVKICEGKKKDLPKTIDLAVDAIGAADAIRAQGYNAALQAILTELQVDIKRID